jgi:hypothetical protein
MEKSAPRYCHTQRFAFQFLPGSCIVHTCVSHFKKSSFAAWSVYKCLKNFIQPFLGRTSIRMQRKCMKSADNFVIFVGRWRFHHRSVPYPWSSGKPTIFTLDARLGTRTRAGPRTLCCNTCAANLRKWLSRKRRSLPFADTHGVERADESYQWLLLLHGASPPARFFEEEKVDLTLSEYTICYVASTSRWKTSRSGTSRNSYTGIGKKKRMTKFVIYLSHQHQKIMSSHTTWCLLNHTGSHRMN